MADNFTNDLVNAFAELRYNPAGAADLNALTASAMNTLLHAEDLAYACRILANLRFCKDNWKKIDKLYGKKNPAMMAAISNAKVLIPQLPDNKTYNTYYVTNATNTAASAYVASYISHRTDLYPAATTGASLTANVPAAPQTSTWQGFSVKEWDGGKTYSLPSNTYSTAVYNTSDYVTIRDANRRELCTVLLSDDKEQLNLLNNIMPYSIIYYGTTACVYSRSYLNSLPAWQDPDPAQIIATIN